MQKVGWEFPSKQYAECVANATWLEYTLCVLSLTFCDVSVAVCIHDSEESPNRIRA